MKLEGRGRGLTKQGGRGGRKTMRKRGDHAKERKGEKEIGAEWTEFREEACRCNSLDRAWWLMLNGFSKNNKTRETPFLISFDPRLSFLGL